MNEYSSRKIPGAQATHGWREATRGTSRRAGAVPVAPDEVGVMHAAAVTAALLSTDDGMADVPRPGAVSPLAVLIVDDDRAVRESMEFLLTGGGYTASVAAGVEEATRVLAERAFEVIITDLVMPGGGRTWIHVLRGLQPDATIIVVTAADLLSPTVDALRSVVFAVLGKPVAPDELLDTVARAVTEGQESR